MLKVPEESAFPGTGAEGNGMPETLKSQAQWLDIVKTNGCFTCHHWATRRPVRSRRSSATLELRRKHGAPHPVRTSSDPNDHGYGRLDTQRAFKLFADWTDRIAAGELPAAIPMRPQGVERNVVITLWDWAGPKHYMHDEVSTDRRNPTVNGNGLIYGTTEESTDLFPILDPVNHKASQVKMPVRDPRTPSSKDHPMAPSPYWGDEPIWDSQTSMHNPMFDEKGRVWFTSRIRPPDNPAFCKKGSVHPSAKLFPIERANRHLSMYEPQTGKITLISTCFPTHHLIFAEDANNTLWTSAGGPQSGVIGWLNRKMFEETGDEEKSQGWTALILDTNGDGKRGDYIEPNQPVDPTKDQRINAAVYSVAVNPVDNSIWGTVLGFPGYVLRLNPGPNPPETALAEVFEPPLPGYGPRGGDIDRNGVFWASLSSGHLASFDRTKCKGPLNGPNATGKHCPEGWTLYPLPGPQMVGVTKLGSAEASYYTWVDQFDTFGLGKNVPIATGNANEALLALVEGKFVTLRVPYPWASTPSGWMLVSMTQMRAGRERRCGRRTAPGHRFTSKAARARPAKS